MNTIRSAAVSARRTSGVRGEAPVPVDGTVEIGALGGSGPVTGATVVGAAVVGAAVVGAATVELLVLAAPSGRLGRDEEGAGGGSSLRRP